jgi:hypothetical protein
LPILALNHSPPSLPPELLGFGHEPSAPSSRFFILHYKFLYGS